MGGSESGGDHVELFTDGACRGNPGPGGWGALLRFGDHEKSLWGGEADTTNNRMELQSVIEALDFLEGMTEWLSRWRANNWKTANKKPVKNVDLWQALYEETQRHDVTWRWVKGHSGHRENEMADELANRAIDEMLAAP